MRKYCDFFLKGKICPKLNDCLYLHEKANSEYELNRDVIVRKMPDIETKRGCEFESIFHDDFYREIIHHKSSTEQNAQTIYRQLKELNIEVSIPQIF